MKKFFLIFCLFFFSYFHIAFALEISEVLYDVEGTDTDREWIEIYNNGESTIDISTYKLFEANVNHGLTLVQGEKNLPVGGYAVIVQNKDKFKIDWPNFTGPIFDSSFSLSNDGENIAIKDFNLNIVNQLNYNSGMGANGDGKSLQKNGNTWQGAVPTLGSMNMNSSQNENNSSSNQNNNSVETNTTKQSPSGTATSILKEEKTNTEIFVSSFGFAKNPLEIKAETRNSEGEKIFYGKYFFNFNDGTSEEYIVSSFEKISHIYKYAGEYLIHLSYYANPYDMTPIATDKFLVTILDAGVFISNVGEEKDFFIEIKNNTNYESDISGWYISSFDKKFVFPKNSFLPANAKIILAPEITNFVFNDKKNLQLYNATGNLIFDYGILSQKKVENSKIVASPAKNNSKSSTEIKNNFIDEKNTDFFDLNSLNHENLEANTNLVRGEESGKYNFWIYLLGLCILLALAVFVVLFLRKKEKILSLEDDFEILE